MGGEKGQALSFALPPKTIKEKRRKIGKALLFGIDRSRNIVKLGHLYGEGRVQGRGGSRFSLQENGASDLRGNPHSERHPDAACGPAQRRTRRAVHQITRPREIVG